MKKFAVKNALAAFKANGQIVMIEVRPHGTTTFIPIEPQTPPNGTAPVR